MSGQNGKGHSSLDVGVLTGAYCALTSSMLYPQYLEDLALQDTQVLNGPCLH